jgi:phage shock protein C
MSISDNLHRMAKSRTDRKVFGVCGGIAHATDTPSWFWRAIFVVLVLCGGMGVIPYLVFWYFMPEAKGDN